MLLRVIDFETCNKSDAASENGIIEVGCTDLQVSDDVSSSKITATWSELCDPGIEIDAEASAVHHLTKGDIKGKPPFSSHEPKLMNGPPDYFVAHNAHFERKLFATGDMPWICTYRIALRVWPELAAHNLQYLRYALGLDTSGHDVALPHRAGPDTVVCALLMQRIIEEARFSFDEMVRFSNGPALLPRIPISKHKGKPWSEVPTDFLQWMLGVEDMDPDLKANARYHLKMREQG